MSNSITKSIPTIEGVKTEFITWRENRGNRRKIPDSLWEEVFKLLPHYTKSDILVSLGINSLQLKRAQARINKVKFNPEPKNSASLFVEAKPLSNITSSSNTNNIENTIEIHRTDGVILKIKNISQNSVSILIDQFLG